MRAFIQQVQAPSPGPDRVELPSTPGQYEHAEWLAPALVEDVFQRVMATGEIHAAALMERPEAERARLILERPGRYVALTREDGRFEGLVDRYEVLERVAEAML
jgi:hypothetical protein